MEIAQEKRGAVFLLGPVGRLDTDSAADLELALQDLLATNATHFVVDLAEINYVSSAGLRVLLMLAKSVEKKGSLRISGLNAQVQQVFDIAGFTRLFQIHPDREAALRDHPAGSVVEPEPAAAAIEPAPRAASKERAAPAEPIAPPIAAPIAASIAAPRDAASAKAAVAPPQEPEPAARREERPTPPSEAPRVASREPTPVARAPGAPKVVAPTLAEHVAKLLAVGPATNAPLDASVNVLSRHAAMLLGVKLDGAPAASASAKPAGASKSTPAAAVQPADEPEEKGGLLSRLFGKKKRSNL